MTKALGFRHIEAIRAVLSTGSVTGAAEYLRITQPAVSNTLRDAEERLGFRLFERRAGALIPNAAAGLLFEEIDQAFVGLDEINALADRIRTGEARRVTIAVTPGFAASVLPAVLAAWRAEVPNAVIAVESRNANLVSAMAGSQRADIGFAPEVPAVRGVSSAVIGRPPMVCYLPATHPLARRGGPIRAEELLDLPMIGPGHVERTDRLVASAFEACGRSPRTVMECPAVITACAMVAAGIGFTLMTPLPSWLLPAGRVAVLRFEPQIRMTYRAYWLDGRLPEHEREALVRLAAREFEAHVVDPS